jgi:glycosyltransferase involved in cell wall biosynthesis
MACELPVAASRVGGLPEIVDEHVGTLFEPADPASLAQGVVRLLESPRLAALGKAARERVVARWTNDRLVDRHVAIYEDVVARRRAA